MKNEQFLTDVADHINKLWGKDYNASIINKELILKYRNLEIIAIDQYLYCEILEPDFEPEAIKLNLILINKTLRS